MADFVVELGAVVVVAAVGGVDVLGDGEPPDEVPVAELDDDVVALTGVPAVAVVPGISLETTRPSTTAAPAARTAAALDVRRTLVWARSRRWDSGGGIRGEVDTTGMSPRQPRIPRTAG